MGTYILKPNFDTRIGEILYSKQGKNLHSPTEKVISINTLVHVAYHSIPVYIKTDKILSEKEYIGTIVTIDHKPNEKVDLSVGTANALENDSKAAP